MGCIRISIGSTELLKCISHGFLESEISVLEGEFKDQSWYRTLESQWNGLGHATPTSIGQLIGILHRDAKLKTRTQINW